MGCVGACATGVSHSGREGVDWSEAEWMAGCVIERVCIVSMQGAGVAGGDVASTFVRKEGGTGGLLAKQGRTRRFCNGVEEG